MAPSGAFYVTVCQYCSSILLKVTFDFSLASHCSATSNMFVFVIENYQTRHRIGLIVAKSQTPQFFTKMKHFYVFFLVVTFLF